MADARHILRISGSDAKSFLQGLVTNDVDKTRDGLVYAALLTPQGKYLADFFMLADGADILIDVNESLTAPLKMRLSMYKLRADVSISEETAGHWHRLSNVTCDGDWNEIEPADTSVGWIKHNPTCTWQIDLCPRMSRPIAFGAHGFLIGIIQIPRHNSGTKAKTADRIYKKDCEITA